MLDVEALVNLMMNSGVAIACLAYFMWFNNNTQEKQNTLLQQLNNLIQQLSEKIDNLTKED